MITESYKAGYIDGAAAELHYKQRCEQLEQLCRDMYGQMDYCVGAANHACMRIYRDRMDALGLLEVDV